MIGAPLLIGAANVTFNDPDATLTAVGVPGAPGAPAVIPKDFGEGDPYPTALRAATVKRYDAPSLNPVPNFVVAVPVVAANRGERVVITTMTSVAVWPALSDSPLDFHFIPSAMESFLAGWRQYR